MRLLAGQGGITGPLPCTPDFLHPITPRHAEHFSFLHFQPWMWIILTHTHLVLLSISNVLGVVLYLPRFWPPQNLVLTIVHYI